MAGARRRLEEEDGQGGLKGVAEKGVKLAKKVGKWGYKTICWSAGYGGKAMWVVSTTALITLFPLLLEVQREQQVLELERLQVKELEAQGVPPQQIAHMGLTPSSEPPVITAQ